MKSYNTKINLFIIREILPKYQMDRVVSTHVILFNQSGASNITFCQEMISGKKSQNFLIPSSRSKTVYNVQFSFSCLTKPMLLTNISITSPTWCNGYRRRTWTQWHEFKSWMRLIAFHIALIPLAKVWIQLFSLQLWVNSRTDWVLQPWLGN